MKKTTFKRKTPLRAKKGFKRKTTGTRTKKPAKSKNGARRAQKKGYPIPDWYKKLPYYSSDHGRGAVQKRMWRVVSQTYRQEDQEVHGPHCAACGRYLEWKDGQLGHWLKYSLCKGWMKYERTNLALICYGCNMKDDAVTLMRLGEELQRRHGLEILEYIDETNRKAKPMKIEDWMMVDFVAKLRPDLVE